MSDLNDILAAEHAAVYEYGALAGRTSWSGQPGLAAPLAAGFAAHRERRDDLTALLRQAGAEPAAAEAAYRLPPMGTPRQVRASAIALENRYAEVCAAAVAGTSGADREWALGALIDSARRLLDLGAPAVPWPGASELG